MYPQGYFHQRMSNDGWQEERYERLSWTEAPIEAALTPDGRPCVTAVPLGDRTVLAAVWRVRLGRVRLFLLDTDLEENAPWDRELSARLYGGDRETRIQQEVILGIGGVRALRALGIEPTVWHLNEGHAAFVALQRIREHIEQRQLVRRGPGRGAPLHGVHHPHAGAGRPRRVPVPPWSRSTWPAAGASMGQHRERFLALGEHDNGHGPQFNMTALAHAHRRAHQRRQRAARRGHPQDVALDVARHARSDELPVPLHHQRRARAHLDVVGAVRAVRPSTSAPTGSIGIDDRAMWERLDGHPRRRAVAGPRRAAARPVRLHPRAHAPPRGRDERVSPNRIVAAGTMLDPNALTIGYARRFTAYKRPELIFHDPERLARILNARRSSRCRSSSPARRIPPTTRPSTTCSGSSSGASTRQFAGRIAFIDDYDMHVAHYLVQGCDVWLNNPRKPLEASGTSGMKAAMNGVPHLSIGDGWWAEGYNGRQRLADRRPGATRRSGGHRRRRCRVALHPARDRRWCPAFYDRDDNGPSRRWLPVVREAMRSSIPRFSTRRMLKQYVTELYVPGVPAASPEDSARPARGAPRRAGELQFTGCHGSPRPTRRTCALCGAKEVSEPRGEERYCRDCWDKKIAVEEIVAREFVLKRYIRAHSAEKYLIYHSTQKPPCRPAHRRRRRLRPLPDDDALPELRVGRRRPITSRATPRAAPSRSCWSMWSPPR